MHVISGNYVRGEAMADDVWMSNCGVEALLGGSMYKCREWRKSGKTGKTVERCLMA
jgi:hypothetical protein